MRGDSSNADYMLYERTAGIYDQERFAGRAGQWGHRRQISILKMVADGWKGKKVLEIGCGTGRITEVMVGWGACVTATDISREMIEVAKLRFSSKGNLRMPEFRMMSVFDIDTDLKDYDYLVMVNVLGRLSNAKGAIRHISSKMSRTCKFMFNFPCLTSVMLPFALIVNVRRRSFFANVTSYWYTPKAIERFCQDAGLQVIGWHGNHYVPKPRLLFPTLPFFWGLEMVLVRSFPKKCPTVLVESVLR